MPTPRTICYLNPLAKIGGAERSLLDLIGALDPQRYRAVIIMPDDGPLAVEAAKLGARIHVVPLPALFRKAGRHAPLTSLAAMLLSPFLLLPVLWRMIRVARRENACLLHANGIKVQVLACVLKVVLRVPVVWHLRDFSSRRRMWPLYRRLARRFADVLIANSRAVAREWDGVHPNVRVIYNGIDIEKFRPPAGEKTGGEFRVAMLGILAPWKGHEVFLRAARLLKERDSAMRAWIIGDEIYDTGGHEGWRGHLENYARELGVDDCMEFLGFRADVPQLLHRTDLVVHASVEPEPFGRVVAEALAAGCAVIAANDGGVPEIVTHEKHALLTAPGDEAALADAVFRYETDTDLRARHAVAGCERVREHFALGETSQAVMAVYERLIK